jgi:hypothetical protein
MPIPHVIREGSLNRDFRVVLFKNNCEEGDKNGMTALLPQGSSGLP